MLRKTQAVQLSTLLAVLSCGRGEQRPDPRSPSPPTPRDEAPKATTPDEEPPGYRARILVGGRDGGPQHGWTDIAVLPASDWSRKACEALLHQELSALSSKRLTTRVQRTCDTKPLASHDQRAGQYLLVRRRVVNDVDIAILLLESPESERLVEPTMTDYLLFASLNDCEHTAATMADVQERARREAAEAAGSWLEEELLEQEERAAKACKDYRAAEERCRVLGVRDAGSTCRGSQQGRGCRDARKQDMERRTCEKKRDAAARSCRTQQSLAEQLRQRSAEPAPEEVQDQPVCQTIR